MVRDRGGRGARRGTAVRAGVGRVCGPPPGRSTARRRDERHAAQRRGERRLADVRAQLLEQPVLAPKTINTANVKNLVPRAVYTHGSERLGSFETTPIVVAGVMYITSPATPNNIVRAFDLRTQKMLWEYTHKNDPVATACCGPNNRGVAVSGGSV